VIGTAEIKAVNPLAALMSAANAAQDQGGAKKAAPSKPANPAAPKPKFTMADYMKLLAGSALKVNIKDVTGAHDIYFVFKNDKAKPQQPVASVSGLQFKDKVE
ncbi:MAG TPA: hypothetical protein VGI43_12705, partial [Mucilaginibacter sp.]